MILNEEQQLLKDTVGEFIARRAPVEQLRKLRDSRDPRGYSEALWQEMVAMGIPAAALQEVDDGLGFGWLGMGAIMETLGRHLSATPLLSTVVLGTSLVALVGTEVQKKRILPDVSAGKLTLALAIDEHNHYSPQSCSTTLSPSGAGYTLQGQKVFVLDGHSADKFIVVARTPGASDEQQGLSLVMVDNDQAGVQIQRTFMMDGRNAANVAFEDVAVEDQQVLGKTGEAWPLLEQVLDCATACIAAEMLGGAQEVFQRTLEHLKERVQFDVKIGSFQALQHRAAKLYCQLESCRSAVLNALATLDKNAGAASLEVSQAKALANECYKDMTNEAVQLHGGMGVTDELDIGLFLKRARVCIQILGDTAFHEDRFATLQNY